VLSTLFLPLCPTQGHPLNRFLSTELAQLSTEEVPRAATPSSSPTGAFRSREACHRLSKR
jgi:hypothetical protein